MRWITLGLLLVASCGQSGYVPPGKSCALVRPARDDWRLRADGTRFADALGRQVFLRGVDMGGRSKFTPFAPFDFDLAGGGYQAALDAYLDRAASWGIDVARVPFVWSAVEPSPGQDDAAFLARYDAFLDGAWQRGIWTVVDFHQDIYAENFCGDGFPAWTIPGTPPAPHHDCANWSQEYLNDAGVRGAFDRFWAAGSTVQASYAAMWDRLAARHADRPGVLGFEPINEPGWGTADTATFEATTLTPFFSTMAARIHGVAPSSLVFFEPTGLAGATLVTALGRPAGDGLVFAPHYYQGYATNSDGVLGDLRKWADQGTAYGVPVWVGEFGSNSFDPNSEEFMRAHFAAFDTLGLSGTEWEYSVATEAWNAETFGLVAADGTEYPMTRAIIRPYPRAVAGSAITFSYDAASGAATLRFTPSSGVTEVSVPKRAYPNGYRVDTTGGCYDGTQPELLLVSADPGATAVEVRLSSR